jgi:hypothetical protein
MLAARWREMHTARMKRPTKSPQATPSKPSEITFGEMIRKAGDAAAKEVVKSNRPKK